MNAEKIVKRIIKNNGGQIDALRLSSAQAKGKAKQYSYWGIADYIICLSKTGKIISRCVGRAESERRSRSLALDDIAEQSEREHKPVIDCIGKLDEADLNGICRFFEKKG